MSSCDLRFAFLIWSFTSPVNVTTPDVVTQVSLYSHYIALLQVEVIHIVVISLTGIFELYLHEVGAFSIAGHIG